MTTKAGALSIIITTCPDQQTANQLIKHLLLKQLAACIQQTPITSDYLWEGKHENASEIKLEIKTLTKLFEPVCTCIREHHPYDCPEIISVAIDQADDQYSDWLQKNVNAS